jgi:hypothetical protein
MSQIEATNNSAVDRLKAALNMARVAGYQRFKHVTLCEADATALISTPLPVHRAFSRDRPKSVLWAISSDNRLVPFAL